MGESQCGPRIEVLSRTASLKYKVGDAGVTIVNKSQVDPTVDNWGGTAEDFPSPAVLLFYLLG